MKPEAHYDYRFEDHSILLKVLEAPCLMPLVRAVPPRITPNQITIAGHLAVGVAVAVAFAIQPLTAKGFGVMGLAILFYVVADAIDGLYARHSRKTSRLGEMLDHWLDAVSVPLLVLAFTLILRVPPALGLASVGAIGVLHYATILHGFRVGYVHLGAIGVVEGLLAGAIACLGAAWWGPAVFTGPLVGEFSLGTLLLVGLVAGSCLAFGPMRRVFAHPQDFVGIAFLLGLIAVWMAAGALSPTLAGLLVVIVSSNVEGRVLRARLLKLPLRRDDLVLTGLVGAGAIASLVLSLPAATQDILAGIALGYGTVTGALAFGRTAAALQAPVAAVAVRTETTP